MGEKICISDLTPDALTAYIVGLGQPKFRAKQIFKWLHQKLVTEFSQMTDQPKALLAQLEEQCTIAAPVIRRRQQSRDGTVKYLLQLADGNCIETVLMRYKYGNTVCVSTQVGCAIGCRFCASTQAGRVRDLTAGEIAAEIYTAQKDTGERVSHIVLMGIGEEINKVATDKATSGKFDLVLDKSAVSAAQTKVFLYTNPSMDITAEVKKELNASAPAGFDPEKDSVDIQVPAAAAPAPAPAK